MLDVAARAYAQSQLQQTVNERTTSGAKVHAEIQSFPFLGRLLVQQKVSKVVLSSAEVKTGSLTFTSVELSMNDVKLSRSDLIQNQKVVITAIGTTTASGDLTASALSDAVGAPIQIGNGKVSARVAGIDVGARVQATGKGLTVQIPGLPLPALTIPGSDLLPCLGGLQLQDGRIHFSCTVPGIPPAVLRLVNGTST